MKRIVVLLAILVAIPSFAAVVTFNRSTTYTDGSAIPAAKIPTITYQVFTGPSATGPWTAGSTVTDNVAITAPDPPSATTWWYTITASLDGATSAKAIPASKTMPAVPPEPPPGCTVK